MSNSDRRQFLKSVLDKLVQAAGTVVVASAAASVARAQGRATDGSKVLPGDVKARADRLAATGTALPDAESATFEFLNGAFRNTPIGGFRNTPVGGFRNTPLGAFRNSPLGAFRNTPLSTFGNGGWPNGVMGGFRNGGWPNGGWRNWW
jgi:hypothetical protein